MPRIPLADVASRIYQEWKYLHTEKAKCEVDVRLISNEDKTDWCLTFGDASYDTWHGAACGATSFHSSDTLTKKAAKEMARDLVEQVECALAASDATWFKEKMQQYRG